MFRYVIGTGNMYVYSLNKPALPHSKLIHVRFPHEDSSLVNQLLDNCRIKWWSVVCFKRNRRFMMISVHILDLINI